MLYNQYISLYTYMYIRCIYSVIIVMDIEEQIMCYVKFGWIQW